MSRTTPSHPLYGLWLIGTRPSKNTKMRMSGGMEKETTLPKPNTRRTWFDIMNEVCDSKKINKDEKTFGNNNPEEDQME